MNRALEGSLWPDLAIILMALFCSMETGFLCVSLWMMCGTINRHTDSDLTDRQHCRETDFDFIVYSIISRVINWVSVWFCCIICSFLSSVLKTKMHEWIQQSNTTPLTAASRTIIEWQDTTRLLIKLHLLWLLWNTPCWSIQSLSQSVQTSVQHLRPAVDFTASNSGHTARQITRYSSAAGM